MLKAEVQPYTLEFKKTVRTSREIFTRKRTYILSVYDTENPQKVGRGEIPVFPSLQPSFTSLEDFEKELKSFTANIHEYSDPQNLPENSAIRFGFETALADMLTETPGLLYDAETLKTLNSGILINGLIWMGSIDEMLSQIDQKLNEGFKCLKLKIGANDFQKELDILNAIRAGFSKNKLDIRLDANGAFSKYNVMEALEKLSKFDVHSIEQPLPRDDEFTREVCRHSPIAIALDEDMIERWWDRDRMRDWLNLLKPNYIIVKPSLIGGLRQADNWIEVAEELGMGWWATSALESNIGLSAIAQWLSTHPDNLEKAHGLGTGEIYRNNFAAPIFRKGERLYLKA